MYRILANYRTGDMQDGGSASRSHDLAIHDTEHRGERCPDVDPDADRTPVPRSVMWFAVGRTYLRAELRLQIPLKISSLAYGMTLDMRIHLIL